MRITKVMAILVAAAAIAACSKEEAAPEPVRSVRTVTVALDSGGGALEFAADVRARTESRLGFRVPGKMTRRTAEVGQHVQAGALLAELDPQDLQLQQTAARAAVQSAQVNYDLAVADFKRYKDLRDQGFTSGADLERRETSLKAAQAQLEQARAQAGVQVNQSGYSRLTATANGVITAVEAEPGAVLAAGTPVVRLAHDGPRDVVFAVPENFAGQLRAAVGKPGGVRVQMAGQPAAPATVREVAAVADPSTRTYLVKADLGRADVQLGQTATVLFDLPRQQGVVKLPLTAVAELQGKTAVWVVDKPALTVRVQPITVAGADGNEVVVSGGLTPGQVVVTAGVHLLTPGQKVKLLDPATPAR